MSLQITLKDTILIATLVPSSTQLSFTADDATELLKALNSHEYNFFLLRSDSPYFFCTGGNLKDYYNKTASEGLKINKKIKELLDFIEKMPIPTCAIVCGDVIGGGIEILSAFDRILCSPSAFFYFWQRKRGLSFGWGGYKRLRKRVSSLTLQKFFMDAKGIDVFTALKEGLIDEIYPETLIERKAIVWFQSQEKLPKVPLRIFKKTFFFKDSLIKKLWMKEEHKKQLKLFIHNRQTDTNSKK